MAGAATTITMSPRDRRALRRLVPNLVRGAGHPDAGSADAPIDPAVRAGGADDHAPNGADAASWRGRRPADHPAPRRAGDGSPDATRVEQPELLRCRAAPERARDRRWRGRADWLRRPPRPLDLVGRRSV